MLNISLSGVLWTAVNLFVLYLLYRKFLWRPVTAMIDSRQAEINHSLAVANDQKVRAEAARAEYDARLAQASVDAEALVRKAKARANDEAQAIIGAAQAEARALAARTQAQLESERQAMLAGARREVAQLVLLTASKVTAGRLGSAEDEALVDAFLSEAGEPQ